MQQSFCNPRVIQKIEKIKTPTDKNFNSKPCNGNNASPPTALRITANGAVQAGHPGVNAAKTPPARVVEFDFTEFVIFIFFILNAIIAKFIPASAEISIVSVIDVIIWYGKVIIIVSK